MVAKTERQKTVLGWRGLLGDEERRVRLLAMVGISILAVSMTFLQFGFVGIGISGEYVGYALGLLAPVALAALLLGKKWGAIEGALSGAVLYLHAQVMPLDIIERYFVTVVSSVVLYATAGFLFGLLFAIGLRSQPDGWRRWLAIIVPCFVVSLLASFGLSISMDFMLAYSQTLDTLLAAVGTGSELVQVTCDTLLTSCLCLIGDAATRWFLGVRGYLDVRTIFRARLLAALMIAFVSVSAVGFIAITQLEKQSAKESLKGELEYLSDQTRQRWGASDEVSKYLNYDAITDESFDKIVDGLSIEKIVEGYDLTDGTVIVYLGDQAMASSNPAYKTAMDMVSGEVSTEEGASDSAASTTETSSEAPVDDEEVLLDVLSMFLAEGVNKVVPEIAESGEMRMVLYGDYAGHYELGYMCAEKVLDVPAIEELSIPAQAVHVMMAKPFSMVFAHRSATLLWMSILTLVLLVVVFVVASRLLGVTVVGPIHRTNAALAKITGGDLDEMVTETGTVEFSALSAGINSTVFSLKEYAAESARRIERDLATARAIQIGALPKNFPAFPGNARVDLHAAMDAAKEVGGDFYDFFEIDDHTVGFLIADVSGKGIPGALFMMAAKAEIQNHLSTGMAPSEAISRANQYLCAHNEAGMFVTVWAATLDWKTGLLTYVNAGHNFPLLRHGRGGSWEWLTKKCGLFLGTFDIAKYRQETLTLEPGDELVLYTDGVNEAFSVNDEEYGNDRLERFLSTHADLRPKELVLELRASVASWAEGAEQSDDVTILSVEFALAEVEK